MKQKKEEDTVCPCRLAKSLLPISLYFHNDEPDAQSRDSLTTTSYPECQQHYATLRNEYIAKQRSAADSALMNEFFDSCVVGNYQRVEALFDHIEAMLDEGHRVVVTVAGYASPLYLNSYNQNLSRRRIESFINMIREWRNGLFGQALDDGVLSIVQKPHGAVAPTTESQSKDPVYGLPAALARRIEILSCKTK